MHHLSTTWIPFLIQMSQFCFFIVKMAPPEKLLAQFDCTACLAMLWKGSSTIYELKPFLAGRLCQVNFQKFSSLTINSINRTSKTFEH